MPWRSGPAGQAACARPAASSASNSKASRARAAGLKPMGSAIIGGLCHEGFPPFLRETPGTMTESKRLEICVVEDEPDLREEVVEYLGECGFGIRGFSASRELYASLLVRPCDIVVLDIGLPGGEDGFAVAERLRESGSVGIVMMTARGETEDRVWGLLRGADVYLVKPVDLLELRAVLVSLGRRLECGDGGGQPAVLAASWNLSPDGWTFSDGTGFLPLTAQERLFLQCLAARPGEAVSREMLVAAIGGDPYDYDYHGLESLVSRLRRKAAEQGVALPLRTVRGTGYLI